MPETLQPLADPYAVMHWASAMREAGDLAPMLAVVRGGVIIASGFIDPSGWEPAVGVAFYGFEASAVVAVMDTWILTAELGQEFPDRTPQEAFEAGDPNAREALVVQWVPRLGDVISLRRTYTDGDGGITWDQLTETRLTGGCLTIAASVVRGALTKLEQVHPNDEFFDLVPADERDRATAKYLGMELR
jgi:hypothetical protein